MANPEHLAILKQGVERWNKWREEHSRAVLHPSPQPRLRRAPVAPALSAVEGREACGQGETEVSPP